MGKERKHPWNEQIRALQEITGKSYNQCLNEIAKANGYNSYNHYVSISKTNKKP